MQQKGETRMDALLLEYEMKKQSMTPEDMASVIGIDRATFYRKRKGESDFTRAEIQKIKNRLGLTPDQVDAIFFES